MSMLEGEPPTKTHSPFSEAATPKQCSPPRQQKAEPHIPHSDAKIHTEITQQPNFGNSSLETHNISFVKQCYNSSNAASEERSNVKDTKVSLQIARNSSDQTCLRNVSKNPPPLANAYTKQPEQTVGHADSTHDHGALASHPPSERPTIVKEEQHPTKLTLPVTCDEPLRTNPPYHEAATPSGQSTNTSAAATHATTTDEHSTAICYSQPPQLTYASDKPPPSSSSLHPPPVLSYSSSFELQPLSIPSKPATDVMSHYSQYGHPACTVYPKPLAVHEEVLNNRDRFQETITEFHKEMGTKYMVPIIGGKELDLHLLYKEVTSRGGINRVIKDRKWREITGVFNFPSTATNASFVVRKYYMSLLYHYEQVYFHGAQGENIRHPDDLRSTSPTSHSRPTNIGSDMEDAEHKKKTKLDLPVTTGDPTSLISQSITGVIDGKLESAYLVTVTINSEKMRGVLYHLPSGCSGEQFAQAFDNIALPSKGSTDPSVRPRRKRRKKSEIKRRDPDHPKPNRSGYNFYFQEQHAKLKLLHQGKDREISKMIGDSWNSLTDEEKAVYQELGIKDKERYKTEMLEYIEKQKGHCEVKDEQTIPGSLESNETGARIEVDLFHGVSKGMVIENAGTSDPSKPGTFLVSQPETQDVYRLTQRPDSENKDVPMVQKVEISDTGSGKQHYYVQKPAMPPIKNSSDEEMTDVNPATHT